MDTEDTKKFLNHCCVTTFLSVGKSKLHEIFCSRWLTYEKRKWSDGGTCISELLKLSESANFSVKNTLTKYHLDRWDITTTNYAIQVVTKEILAKGGKIKQKEEKFIRAIRGLRNELSHMEDDCQLSDNEREKYMNQLKNVYKNFGMKKGDIFEEEQKAMFKSGFLEVKENGTEDVQNEGTPKVNEDKEEKKSGYESCESESQAEAAATNGGEEAKATTEDTSNHASIDAKKEFKRLIGDAHKLFKAKKYTETITFFKQISKLPNLSQDDQGLILLNRSAVYLKLKTAKDYKAAKQDAERAVQLWPWWHKGYYRLAQAQIKLHELEEAKKSLEKALALNNSAKGVSDDLSAVKSKLGVILSEEHLKNGIPNKELLEKVYQHEKQKLLDSKKITAGAGSSALSTTSVARSLERIKQNPQRKLFLHQHREAFITVAEPLASGYVTGFSVKQDTPPPKKLPNIKTLKKISLKDMDPTVDKIYDGFILDARIIDYGLLVSSISFVIEDENGDIQRLAIYGWLSKGIQVLDFMNAVKTFRPNVKVTIINPYMRMSASKLSAIRVDNPQFIEIDDTNADNKCSCCGKETAVAQCKICMMSRYCSKECQKYDWNELNHQKVCNHLKNCSKF